MNEKGFTLTELLVTIAILGVIMVIALPAISNLKTDNKNQEYEAYEKVLRAGAQLYIDKNKNDLFPSTNKSCVKILVNKLITEDLVKKYDKNGITCNDSYVVVEKISGSYDNITYTPVVICKKDSTEIYKTSSTADCSTVIN